MATIQTVHYEPNHISSYAFLSRPPQKKRPTQPLPPTPPTPTLAAHRRLNTFSSIASWAAHVQPGSPGSPHSPHSPRRRTSVSRRPSITRRRRSISCSPANSFLQVLDTPTTPAFRTPSIKDFDFDLTNLGYTSVFVHIPKTPTTPPTQKQPPPPPATQVPMINPDTFPIPESPAPRTLNRFRSLAILRSRSRSLSKSSPPSPTKSTLSSSKSKSKPKPTKKSQPPPPPQICAASIAKRKKAVYAYASKSKHTPAPPPLANELALMQFVDGGSMDANIRRLMEAQAKAAARPGHDLSLGDVYRDGKGGLWWDREEELEYAHLLGGGVDGDEEMRWVVFGDEEKQKELLPMDTAEDNSNDASLAIASLAGLGRRDSSTSTQSRDSDMDPCNLVKPAEEDAGLLHISVPQLLPIPISAPAPATARSTKRAPKPLLTLPSRPQRAHAHLRSSPQFILDLSAFVPPASPRSPAQAQPRTPLSPLSLFAPPTPRTPTAKKSASPTRTGFVVGASSRPRGKARRRPAPLKLAGHAGAGAAVAPPVSAGMDVDAEVEQGRRDFLDASFVPSPRPVVAPVPVTVPTVAPGRSVGRPVLKAKSSRMELRFGALFGRKE